MNFFITNREIIKPDDGSPEYIRKNGRETAGDNLRFGTYDLKKKKFDLFIEPKNERELIYKNVSDKKSAELAGTARFFKHLYELLTGKNKGDVLFFIHGFNTNLNDVEKTFNTLNKKYVVEGSPIKHIIIFTWPSRSPVAPLHYNDDKEDAWRSGKALSRAFGKLTTFYKDFLGKAKNKPCNQKIHLMVHSMGHRVLRYSFRAMADSGHHKPMVFNQILLMAADTHYDVFSTDYKDLIDLGQRVHIYYHNHDKALDISVYTKNFSNRLGHYGRKIKDPKLTYIIEVDATKVKDDKFFDLVENAGNHWYYYSSTTVIKDVIKVLNGHKLKDRKLKG